MSGTDDDAVAGAQQMMCCASCGIAEVDDIQLKECDGCDLVRYCSDSCQEDHRAEHEGKCNERAAELRNEILFRQPESTHLGDCPICCVPIPLDPEKSSMSSCCSKQICLGCLHTYALPGLLQEVGASVQHTCPFCRHPITTEEEGELNMKKRVEANDPFALQQVGAKHFNKGDYGDAFYYWKKAAEFGDVGAHYYLSILYKEGKGVERDERKEVYHLEEAAIGGHPTARHNLGAHEGKNGRVERALKHFIIAANLGFDLSLKVLKEYYKDGDVSKEDFAAALRAYQVAVNESKSPQREAAAKFAAAMGLGGMMR